jgi:hypothetical protein
MLAAAHVADSFARLRYAPPSVVQDDRPGRSLVIVDETAVTQHHMWLLPSPWTEAVDFWMRVIVAARTA